MLCCDFTKWIKKESSQAVTAPSSRHYSAKTSPGAQEMSPNSTVWCPCSIKPHMFTLLIECIWFFFSVICFKPWGMFFWNMFLFNCFSAIFYKSSSQVSLVPEIQWQSNGTETSVSTHKAALFTVCAPIYAWMFPPTFPCLSPSWIWRNDPPLQRGTLPGSAPRQPTGRAPQAGQSGASAVTGPAKASDQTYGTQTWRVGQSPGII